MKTKILRQTDLEAKAALLRLRLAKHDARVCKLGNAVKLATARYNKACDERHDVSEALAGTNGLVSSCKGGEVEVLVYR